MNPILEAMRKRFCADDPAATVGVVNIKASAIKASDPKNPDDIVCVATTDYTDLDSEVVVPGGADMSYFLANNAIFVDHNYDVESVVAKRRSIVAWPDVTALKGWRVRCSLVKGSRFEPTIRALAQDGVLGCSIGLQAMDWGPLSIEEKAMYPKAKSIVRRWKWLELSFTSMPCNQECRVTLSGSDNVTNTKAKRTIVVV